MDFDVVERIKLSPEEVVEQDCGIVGRFRVYGYDGSR